MDMVKVYAMLVDCITNFIGYDEKISLDLEELIFRTRRRKTDVLISVKLFLTLPMCEKSFFPLNDNIFHLQVNRPITLKKENIQTRNRKPNSKRNGSNSSKDKDPFPYGFLMKNEATFNGYHAQAAAAAMAVNSGSSSPSSSAAYAAAAAFHPLFSSSMLSSIGTTGTSTSSSSPTTSPIKSSYMNNQQHHHHMGVYPPYF